MTYRECSRCATPSSRVDCIQGEEQPFWLLLLAKDVDRITRTEFIGQVLEIAGSELTNPQAAEVFSRVLGKPVEFQELPMPVVRSVLGEEYHQMYRWFNEERFRANIEELRHRYREVHLCTLNARHR